MSYDIDVTLAFIIDRSVIGTQRHLLVNGGFQWVEEIPHDAWHLSGDLKTTNKCLDTVFRLEGINVETKPPQQFYDAMMTLMSGSSAWPPPWQDVMSSAAHRRFVNDLINSVAVAIEHVDTSFYEMVWVPGNRVFGSLQRATINKAALEGHLNDGDGNVPALKTFTPDESGFAQKVVYNRFGARTGRPSMKAGPSILTLKREHRDIITSRWGDQGRIVMFDFAALEVRVILYDAGFSCDNPDLYDELNQQLFKGKMPRSAVKQAIISDLYGQSKWALSEQLGLKGKHLDAFLDRIRSRFRTEDLLKRVKQQFVEKGFITNHYGRKVTIEDPLDHILVNSYAQSTGADVVTLGFNKILDQIEGLRAIPVFLLVDAILIDCHVDDIHFLRDIKSVVIEGYEQSWPLKCEVM